MAAGATAYVSFFVEEPEPEPQSIGRRDRTPPPSDKAEQEMEAQTPASEPNEGIEGEMPFEAELSGEALKPDPVAAPEPTGTTPAAPVQQTPSRPATPKPQATPNPPEEAPAPELPPVAIRIISVPFGIPVLVDGKPVGRTPIQNLLLSPGSHVLLFQDGENSIRHEIQVTADGKSSWKYIQTERKVR